MVASVFSNMLNLHNLSEDVLTSQQELAERVGEISRTTRSTDETFHKLVKMGVSPEDIYKALCNQKVELVLTAHPTQALRRSQLKKNSAIRNSLTVLHDVKLSKHDKTECLETIQGNIEAMRPPK